MAAAAKATHSALPVYTPLASATLQPADNTDTPVVQQLRQQLIEKVVAAVSTIKLEALTPSSKTYEARIASLSKEVDELKKANGQLEKDKAALAAALLAYQTPSGAEWS